MGLDLDEQRKATISDCGRYRYTLERRVGPEKRAVCFILHNPSTADSERDDPTVRRCCGFARRWGFGRLVIVNLYAWRSTDPRDLFRFGRAGDDIVGPMNDVYIRHAFVEADLTVAAWGALPAPGKDERIARIREIAYRPVHVLGLCKRGTEPRHPLYLRRTTEPVPWEGWEGACDARPVIWSGP